MEKFLRHLKIIQSHHMRSIWELQTAIYKRIRISSYRQGITITFLKGIKPSNRKRFGRGWNIDSSAVLLAVLNEVALCF